jgi:glycosyltransferase involved in cell wall biosynthesis
MEICVDLMNIEEIAKAIKYLQTNKEIAKQTVENCRLAFEREFNWQIEEKKLIKLYNSL